MEIFSRLQLVRIPTLDELYNFIKISWEAVC